MRFSGSVFLTQYAYFLIAVYWIGQVNTTAFVKYVLLLWKTSISPEWSILVFSVEIGGKNADLSAIIA